MNIIYILLKLLTTIMCLKHPTYYTGYMAILYWHALHSFLLGTLPYSSSAISEMVLISPPERLATLNYLAKLGESEYLWGN